MSLAYLESQIADLRAKAAGIQRQWAADKDSIDADSRLIPEGKQEEIEHLYAGNKSALDALRQQEIDLIEAKRRSLERSLFGLSSVASSDPNQIIAYRDARDRVARLEDVAQAQTLYDAAIRSDDKTLIAALLAKAVEPTVAGGPSWRSIRDAHIREHPSAGEDLTDLARLQSYNTMQRALAYAIRRIDFSTPGIGTSGGRFIPSTYNTTAAYNR
ncbi:hypothetical protein PDG61_10120 [Mycolicibacterium sp. BiH015]|uniref:hypothetical protein n=1 Tax=Mycolicibacterium sp. BiH015 TaxID=3018808 RepID=UPI0022E5E485|nr:hypothetical protein [Mycolicibacterium sp. BiH015]MDA2891264.1 hypothetical protein [Mycolicibacterium sp. BiH015]